MRGRGEETRTEVTEAGLRGCTGHGRTLDFSEGTRQPPEGFEQGVQDLSCDFTALTGRPRGECITGTEVSRRAGGWAGLSYAAPVSVFQVNGSQAGLPLALAGGTLWPPLCPQLSRSRWPLASLWPFTSPVPCR